MPDIYVTRNGVRVKSKVSGLWGSGFEPAP